MPVYTMPLRPAVPVNGYRREMARLFDDVANARPQVATTWQPPVDAREDATGFTLDVELPGVDPLAVEVLSEDGTLTVRGSKGTAEAQPGEQIALAERARGEFLRQFRLPKSADLQSVSASYANGLLTVRVAKVAPSHPRRVPITISTTGAQ